MDSGTDTWVIVMAAFGGGLAGAILQPVMAHLMQRMRSNEEIRKERERNLRRMLVTTMQWTARLQTHTRTRGFYQSEDTDIDLNERVKWISLVELPFWEAERIQDAELRGLATDLNDARAEMYQQWSRDASIDGSVFTRLDETLSDLRSQITKRMDHLNWPEVEV